MQSPGLESGGAAPARSACSRPGVRCSEERGLDVPLFVVAAGAGPEADDDLAGLELSEEVTRGGAGHERATAQRAARGAGVGGGDRRPRPSPRRGAVTTSSTSHGAHLPGSVPPVQPRAAEADPTCRARPQEAQRRPREAPGQGLRSRAQRSLDGEAGAATPRGNRGDGGAAKRAPQPVAKSRRSRLGGEGWRRPSVVRRTSALPPARSRLDEPPTTGTASHTAQHAQS